MDHSKQFKLIEVEKEEIVNEILEKGGIPHAKYGFIQYYVQHEGSDS